MENINSDSHTTSVLLTPEAVAATRQLREENVAWQNLSLRLYLAGKGCDGFNYGVTFDETEPNDNTVAITDDITLLVDPDTTPFVQGSTIDWVDDERGRGYVVENPNHKKFRGKFFKRSNWQSRLLGADNS